MAVPLPNTTPTTSSTSATTTSSATSHTSSTSSHSPSPFVSPSSSHKHSPSATSLHKTFFKTFSSSSFSPVSSSTPPKPSPKPSPKSSTPAPAPSSADSTTAGSDIDQYLSAHNSVRSQHGASPLTWSNTLASAAQQWADGCKFQHSGGSLGPYGGKYCSLPHAVSCTKILIFCHLQRTWLLVQVVAMTSLLLSNHGRTKSVSKAS